MATWPESLGIPQFSGYDLETNDPTIRTDMEGGSARVRRRSTTRTDNVQLRFVFNETQMAMFRAFWEADLAYGSAWVNMPIKDGRSAGVQTRECRPIAGKFQASPLSTTHWAVSLQVEIRSGIYYFWETLNALGLPSLELDFAGSKSLSPIVSSVAQPTPAVTFTRASSATYIDESGVIATAAVNMPRFDHDPVSLACKGLLIEESRTNLLTYSEQFDNAGWNKTNTVVSPGAAVAPDGTVSADFLTETASSSVHYTYKGASVTAGTVYTLSFYLKAGTKNRVAIRTFGTNGAFANEIIKLDLATGVVTYVGNAPLAYGIIPAKDGWYRAWLSFAALATVTGNISVSLLDASGNESYAGDGVSGLYLWGAQLEAGSFPTSYIPTTSAQATRAADVAQMTGTNFSSWYRQDEGTLVTEHSMLGASSDAPRVAAIQDGAANYIHIIDKGNTQLAAETYINSTFPVSMYATRATLPKTKAAFAYKKDDFALSRDGSTVVTDTAGDFSLNMNSLHLGKNHTTIRHLNGHLARLSYYPKRLSNSELQGLSA